jgi:hypothetical protein
MFTGFFKFLQKMCSFRDPLKNFKTSEEPRDRFGRKYITQEQFDREMQVFVAEVQEKVSVFKC